MPKFAVAVTAAIACAAIMSSSRAEAMISGALAPVRAAIDASRPLEKTACGWYPIDYPQSWAVYTRGWGCRQVYSPYNYAPYPYGPSSRVYGAPALYANPPYWRRRLWWAWY